MANQLTLTIGANTVSVPIKGTTAQINAAVKRYAIQKGIPVDGRTATEIGTDVLTSLLKTLRDGSIDRQRVELKEAQDAANEATIATDNDL